MKPWHLVSGRILFPVLNCPETFSFDISLPNAFQALPPGGTAPSAFGSWQDLPCLAGAEVAHVPLDEGQWAVALSPGSQRFL